MSTVKVSTNGRQQYYRHFHKTYYIIYGGPKRELHIRFVSPVCDDIQKYFTSKCSLTYQKQRVVLYVTTFTRLSILCISSVKQCIQVSACINLLLITACHLFMYFNLFWHL